MNVIDITIANICEKINKDIEENKFNMENLPQLIDSLSKYRSVKGECVVEIKQDSTLPRMRTIAECVKYIKEQDPESKITENILRANINNGKLRAVISGNKKLLNLDTLLDDLITCQEQSKKVEQNKNKIRAVY